MLARVFGQVGDGPVVSRTVTIPALFAAWGRFAMDVYYASKEEPLIVDGYRVWTELVG